MTWLVTNYYKKKNNNKPLASFSFKYIKVSLTYLQFGSGTKVISAEKPLYTLVFVSK